MNTNEINSGVLAYLGDSVYEVEIRNYLVSKKISNVNELQKESINYVSAKSQAVILEKLLEQNIFTEHELYTIGRGRNYKPNSKPKYTDIKVYKKATALEALFGALYLENNIERIKELVSLIIG